MAILSTFQQYAHKYDLETAALLRASASAKNRYPEFIATLLTSAYSDDVAIYAQETGFFLTYKRMIEAPTEQELPILPLLLSCLPLFPHFLRNKIQAHKFVWPPLTDDRLIALKETLTSVIQEQSKDKAIKANKQDFYIMAMELNPDLLLLPEYQLIPQFKKLTEDQVTIIYEHWSNNPEWTELADRIFNALYMV